MIFLYSNNSDVVWPWLYVNFSLPLPPVADFNSRTTFLLINPFLHTNMESFPRRNGWLANSWKGCGIIAWTFYYALSFSPWNCYSASTSLVMVLTLAVKHMAVFPFFNCWTALSYLCLRLEASENSNSCKKPVKGKNSHSDLNRGKNVQCASKNMTK